MRTHLKKIIDKMDSLCREFSSTLGYSEEAYEIRKILLKIEEKEFIKEAK